MSSKRTTRGLQTHNNMHHSTKRHQHAVVVGSSGTFAFRTSRQADSGSLTSFHTTTHQPGSVNSTMALSNGTISTHSSARMAPQQRHSDLNNKIIPLGEGPNQQSTSRRDENALVIKITQQSDGSQEEVFRKVTKTKLFPFVKFIINIDTDKRVRFSREPNTVCGIVLRSSNVSLVDNEDSFLIPWWNEKIKIIKTEITTHRNNVIKAIKHKYFGKCYSLSVDTIWKPH